MTRITAYDELHHSEEGAEAMQVVMLLSIGALVMMLFGTLYDNFIEDPANIAVDKALAGEGGAWIVGDASGINSDNFDEGLPYPGDPDSSTNNSVVDGGPAVVSTVPPDDSTSSPNPSNGDAIGGGNGDLAPGPTPISFDPDSDVETPPTEPGESEPGMGPDGPVPPSQTDSENDDSGCMTCDCGKDFLFGLGSQLFDEISGLLELAWNLITSPIDTTKEVVKGVVEIIRLVMNGEFDEAAKDIIPKTYEYLQVLDDPSVSTAEKCGLFGEAVVEVVATVGGPGKIKGFIKKFKRPKGSKTPTANTPSSKPDVDSNPGPPSKTPTDGQRPNNNGSGNNSNGKPPKKPDEPLLLPPPALSVDSKIGQKILYGEPKPRKPREFIGGHSPRVQGNDNFRLTDIKKNADGTTTATIEKRMPDGTWSKKKKNNTIAPNNWTDEKIMIATRDTGLQYPKFRRTRDGATLHVKKIDGVEWVVIKDQGGKVTSSYPTGGNSPKINQGGFDEQLY